jgi:hypothetical protein
MLRLAPDCPSAWLRKSPSKCTLEPSSGLTSLHYISHTSAKSGSRCHASLGCRHPRPTSRFIVPPIAPARKLAVTLLPVCPTCSMPDGGRSGQQSDSHSGLASGACGRYLGLAYKACDCCWPCDRTTSARSKPSGRCRSNCTSLGMWLRVGVGDPRFPMQLSALASSRTSVLLLV